MGDRGDDGENKNNVAGNFRECGETESLDGALCSQETEETEESQEREKMAESAQQISRAAELSSETTHHQLESLKLKTEENYAVAQEQIKVTVAFWHSLVEEKEAELRRTLEETRASKLTAFAEREAVFTELVNRAKKLVSESATSESASRELVEQAPSLLASLSSPISPHHSHLTAHPGLGFCSNITDYIAQALTLGMWVSGEDVRVGEKISVSVVGGLQPNGTFWVRRVTSDPWRQEYALQHISNSLFEVPQTSKPLEECSSGQLCVGQFSQDGRWYRAVVVSLPRPGVAKYFFLDHGGSEEAPISSLYPLPHHFRALPFQMVHVRLTSDPSVDFNTREMRWCFTDCTHKKQLMADILGQSEVEEAGPVYLVRLEDHTQEQPFDVGQMLVVAAQMKEPTSKFKSRDVRFKEKRASALQATPTETTTAAGQSTEGESRETETDKAASHEEDGSERVVEMSSPPEPVGGLEEGGASCSQSDSAPSTSLLSSSPPHAPSPQGTGSPNSQPSPAQSAVQAGLDAIPRAINSDTTPYDSGTDTIPPDGSPDSIPHKYLHKQVASPDSIPPVNDETSHPKPKPLLLGEIEDVLLSNEAPPSDDNVAVATEEGIDVVEKLHPSVKIGERLEVEVVTDLSPEGDFWGQLLLPREAESYDRLQEELQAAKRRAEDEAFTPVFYHEGELCIARFSEDGNWYRARIERLRPGAPHMLFTVRYVDFGNFEERQQHQLVPLGSKFKLLPPRAVHCSIATAEHVTFTPVECKKFNELTSQDGISIEVLAMEEEEQQPVRVRLLQTLPDSDSLDISELILSAGRPAGKHVPRRQWSSSTDMEPQLTAHVADWASHMEDQQEDSVFLTLPGHESSRETTPLAREATPTNEVTSTQREATPIQQETTNQRARLSREATPTNQRRATPTVRTTSPVAQKEATPTTRPTASPVTTTTAKGATPQREATPTQQEATPSQWIPLAKSSNFLQRVTPSNRDSPRAGVRQARLDLSRAKHSIISSLGAKPLPRPHRHDDADGSVRSRTRHSKPDHISPGKLYVKCQPEDLSDSKIKELFGRYGNVLDLDPHTTDSSIVYVTMDVKGAEEVVDKLNGYQTSPGHHLVVEKYRTRSPSPPPPHPAPSSVPELTGTEHVRLFVKNMSPDHSLASLKTVFSRYGRVLKMVPDSKRKNVTFIYMDAEGGTKAINKLHGKAISKNGKPLVVELSYEPKNR